MLEAASRERRWIRVISRETRAVHPRQPSTFVRRRNFQKSLTTPGAGGRLILLVTQAGVGGVAGSYGGRPPSPGLGSCKVKRDGEGGDGASNFPWLLAVCRLVRR